MCIGSVVICPTFFHINDMPGRRRPARRTDTLLLLLDKILAGGISGILTALLFASAHFHFDVCCAWPSSIRGIENRILERVDLGSVARRRHCKCVNFNVNPGAALDASWIPSLILEKQMNIQNLMKHLISNQETSKPAFDQYHKIGITRSQFF